jgi:hypothetical protein
MTPFGVIVAPAETNLVVRRGRICVSAQSSAKSCLLFYYFCQSLFLPVKIFQKNTCARLKNAHSSARLALKHQQPT